MIYGLSSWEQCPQCIVVCCHLRSSDHLEGNSFVAGYSALTIKAFLQRRKQLSELMAGNSDLNFNRYFRLMALAVVNMLFMVPLGIYTMIVNTTESPIYIWRGLSDLHFDFSAVDQYPAIIWRANPLAQASMLFSEWSFIGCALLFYAFFGFGDEALRNYRKVYDAAVKRLGIRPGAWQRLPESLKWRTRHADTFYSADRVHTDHSSFPPLHQASTY